MSIDVQAQALKAFKQVEAFQKNTPSNERLAGAQRQNSFKTTMNDHAKSLDAVFDKPINRAEKDDVAIGRAQDETTRNNASERKNQRDDAPVAEKNKTFDRDVSKDQRIDNHLRDNKELVEAAQSNNEASKEQSTDFVEGDVRQSQNSALDEKDIALEGEQEDVSALENVSIVGQQEEATALNDAVFLENMDLLKDNGAPLEAGLDAVPLSSEIAVSKIVKQLQTVQANKISFTPAEFQALTEQLGAQLVALQNAKEGALPLFNKALGGFKEGASFDASLFDGLNQGEFDLDGFLAQLRQGQSSTPSSLPLLQGGASYKNGGEFASLFSSAVASNAQLSGQGINSLGAVSDVNGLSAPVRLLSGSGQGALFSASNTHQAKSAVPLAAPLLAGEISRQVLQGKTQFDIRLDPPELGRVHVRMEVDEAGQSRTHLIVERPETLAMLQKDAQNLERALAQSGLKSEGSLSFSIREEGSQNMSQSFKDSQDQHHAQNDGTGDYGENMSQEDNIIETNPLYWTAQTGLDVHV